jgi:opacity protein-like surface antigen
VKTNRRRQIGEGHVIKRGVLLGVSLASLVGNLLVGVRTVEAQAASHAPEVRVIAGTVRTYLDEPGQPAIGAGFRLALASRLFFEPEVLRLAGSRFESWQFLGNVTYSLRTNARATPYFVAGIGVNSQRDKAIDYESSQKVVNGGFGVRIALTDRVSVSPEGRLGLGTFPRLTVASGVALR